MQQAGWDRNRTTSTGRRQANEATLPWKLMSLKCKSGSRHNPLHRHRRTTSHEGWRGPPAPVVVVHWWCAALASNIEKVGEKL
jgi:hypothetical protein